MYSLCLVCNSTVAERCCCDVVIPKSSRKQLYPLGKNNYPTLVQKHFNGAVPGLKGELAHIQLFLHDSLAPNQRNQLSSQSG